MLGKVVKIALVRPLSDPFKSQTAQMSKLNWFYHFVVNFCRSRDIVDLAQRNKRDTVASSEHSNRLSSLFDAQAWYNNDLENNVLSLILSGDSWGLQKYMWLCKLQSVLHVQHENKVLNPGLSVQRIATDLKNLFIRTSKSPRRKQNSWVSWYYLVTLKSYNIKPSCVGSLG